MIKCLCLFSFILGSQAKAIEDNDLRFLAPIASQRATDFLRLAAHKDLFECDFILSDALQAKYREHLTGTSEVSIKRKKKSVVSTKNNEVNSPSKWLVSALKLSKLRTGISSHDEKLVTDPLRITVESLKAISFTHEGRKEVVFNAASNSALHSLNADRYELLVSLKRITQFSSPAVNEDLGYSYQLILNRKRVNLSDRPIIPDVEACLLPDRIFPLGLKTSATFHSVMQVGTLPDSTDSLMSSSSNSNSETSRLTNERRGQMSSFSSLSGLSDLALDEGK